LSDIAMPGEDGYALIRKVRALESPARMLPAAAFTASATAADRARALLAGFQAHIPKPVEPSELAAVVAALAGRTVVNPLIKSL
jgi:CheY-like chemotaxis protein